MHNVAAFTEGKNVPSARYRVEQYIDILALNNINLVNFPSRYGKYPPSKKSKRPYWFLAEIFSRLSSIFKGNLYFDSILLQRELISQFSFLEKLINKPIIFDFDDSIFLGKNKKNIESIVLRSDKVICGNSYLAEWASSFSKNVFIIPTGIDTKHLFNPLRKIKKFFDNDKIIIGWIGTSSNLNNFLLIESALQNLINDFPELRIAIMSDIKPSFKLIPDNRIIFMEWSPLAEISFLNSIDIGIMPLFDNEWTRGKCSFKAIQYMSMQKPVVLSNVGMNKELIKHNCNGLLAKNTDEWTDQLRYLINYPTARKTLGSAGRETICNDYDVEIIGEKIANVIKSI